MCPPLVKLIATALLINALLICFVLQAQAQSNQDSISYPELELYRQSISAERTEAYEQALKAYNEIPKANPATKTSDIVKLSRSFEEALRGDLPNFASAFLLALDLEAALDAVTEDEYPQKRADYFRLGEAYYLFNDFEKTISVLKKAITDNPPRSFTDQANLDARKIIGICYANIDDMDTSDAYFRSILESGDLVLDRPLYNHYAMSYLGCNAMMRGQYAKALALDDAVLPFFRSYTDYGHLAGMYYCRATGYFALNDIPKAGLAADSVLIYANQDTYNPNKRRKQAFSALIRYNAAISNAALTKNYSDSLTAIYKSEASLYTSQYIANARMVKAEQAEAKASDYLRNMFWGFALFVISLLVAVYIFIQYRRLRQAHRMLVDKSRLWAEQLRAGYQIETKSIDNEPIDADEAQIMQRVHDYVIIRGNYSTFGLSLDVLAAELNINRSYLSSAVNKMTGKNFNAYINEYRVSEAIRLFNENESLSVENICQACGFNNRSSFYRNFKKITGLSPIDYRENVKKD